MGILEDPPINVRLARLGAKQSLLHRFERLLEDGGAVVDTFEERVDLDAGLLGTRESALRPIAGQPQAAHGPRVARQVLLVLLLELLDEVVHRAVVEVLAAQVRVSGGGLDHKQATIQCQDKDSEIVHQDVALAFTGLYLVEAKAAAVGSSASLMAWR
jgi:hypothetical protein